jgi:signal transduction histidine kinase
MDGKRKQLSDSWWQIRRFLHELTQPLAAVTGLVDLLLLQMAEQDPRWPQVDMISRQMEKVGEILQQIRQVARETSGAACNTMKPRPPH